MKKLVRTIMVALLALPWVVFAMPVLNVDASGQLVGASNIDVNGSVYDVAFVDGICPDLIAGCNGVGSFVFTDETAAIAATRALLDQVFSDVNGGVFSREPSLTYGCEVIDSCGVLTPWSLISVNPVIIPSVIAENRFFTLDPNDPPRSRDQLTTTAIRLDWDLADRPDYVWADWTPHAPVAVLTPATLPLLLAGLAALGAARRRKTEVWLAA